MTHRHVSAIAWLGLVTALLVCPAPAHAAPRITVRARLPATQPAAFERLERVVELDKTYDNPFDPEQIAVTATFTPLSAPAPGSAATAGAAAANGPAAIVLPAFWYQDHQREVDAAGGEKLKPVGSPCFLVRFAAPQAGDWQLLVTARDREGESRAEPLRFTVGPARQPGFVRRVPGNPRYLQFDSGQPFFIVGLNVGWAGKRGLDDFERWFTRLSDAGGNFARVWAPIFSRPIEHKGTGLGRYDLANAWYYDQVLELAAQRRLYCMWALNNFLELETGKHWPINPYNAANGGPATQPSDFATNPAAKALYQRRLRYTVARYSAFTSLAVWELWNEQSPRLVPTPWVREMARYLKASDPYGRLVSTSYITRGPDDVWRLPEIDLTQRHHYGHEGSMRDIAPALPKESRTHDPFGKPHLAAEFGISWAGPDGKFDPQGRGTSLHNGLWAGALSGDAGGGCIWWWDNYVDPKNLWPRFTGLSRFAGSIDWPRRRFEALKVEGPTLSLDGPETFSTLHVPSEGGWGKAPGKVIVVDRGGLADGPLPTYLYGPAKPELRARAVMDVDLPTATRMIVHVGEVSDFAMLRVLMDDEPVVDFAFSALPGVPDQTSTKLYKPDPPEAPPAPPKPPPTPSGGGAPKPGDKPAAPPGKMYQAVFNKDRAVDVPAGKHRIALDNVGGDWLTLRGVSFEKGLSSRYGTLRVIALADAAGGEVIAWVQDPMSNWHSDSNGIVPRHIAGATLTLPVTKTGDHRVEWWDTRKGEVIRADTATPREGKLALPMPAFERDIAVRVTVVKQ